MELSGIDTLFLLLVGPLAIALMGEVVLKLYRGCLKKYERGLANAYHVGFQSRVAEALNLNAGVGLALLQAKRIVDEARQHSLDDLLTQPTFHQISLWLGTAAETSDRALRSLEGATRSQSDQFLLASHPKRSLD